MTTQAKAGKSKKKSKDTVIKLSLEEFNLTSAPEGLNAINVATVPKLDWAETMREYEAETKKVYLPTGPRSQRGPAIAREELPKESPFKAIIDGLSMHANPDDLRKLFKDCNLKSVDVERGVGYAEFETADDLYEALGLSGQSIKGKSIEVKLESHSYRPGGGRHVGTYDRPNRTERPGFRNPTSSGGIGSSSADEADNWRAPRPAASTAGAAPPAASASNRNNNTARPGYVSRHSLDPDRRTYQPRRPDNQYPSYSTSAGAGAGGGGRPGNAYERPGFRNPTSSGGIGSSSADEADNWRAPRPAASASTAGEAPPAASASNSNNNTARPGYVSRHSLDPDRRANQPRNRTENK